MALLGIPHECTFEANGLLASLPAGRQGSMPFMTKLCEEKGKGGQKRTFFRLYVMNERMVSSAPQPLLVVCYNHQMNWMHAVIFGVVEGLTEFLPVSSTGHLILTAKLMGLQQTEFIKSFEIAIQLGAILAVVLIYWRVLWSNFQTAGKVLAAFIPTAGIGLVLYKWIKSVLLEKESVVLWALLIGGVVIILFDRFFKENKSGAQDASRISYKQAIIIGVCQSLAVIPGVSRSASSIIGGLSLGLTRKMIVEFSFLLAIPTILAATVLDLTKTSLSFTSNEWGLLAIGGFVSFVVAILSIQFFLKYIQKHSFAVFGYYRIILAVLFWGFVK